MQIGWIDFSEKDRRKALDVIHLLQEQGAMDELGIGSVRDAFANVFFPGTSTIQTRAKYFFIVPYAIKDCCENTKYHNVPEIRKAIDDIERTCAMKMKDEKDHDGVIGVDSLPQKWVVRKPSSIYWNGIRTLGIFFNRHMSIDECIKESLVRRSAGNFSNWTEDGEENEQDDRSAGHEALHPLWNLPPSYNKKWIDSLSVKLSEDEADFLRKDILERLPGTLYKYVLENEIDLRDYITVDTSFRALFEAIKDDISEDMRQLMVLAIKFDTLVYLCRVLFNRCLSDDNNTRANDEWAAWYTPDHLHEIQDLDINEVFLRLKVTDRGVKGFLTKMRSYLLNGDIDAAKKKIEDWEVELKGEKRSKLRRKNEFPNDNYWIGGGHLDYRLSSAARILKDIYAVEGRGDV